VRRSGPGRHPRLSRTKHHPQRFAAALGFLDWENQPDPFRRFEGAPLLPLDLADEDSGPRYEPAFLLGHVAPEPLDRRSVSRLFQSRLFQDSLAISAWKQAGRSRWSLRVNPSSGNLHPTEGYLVAGPLAGLHARAAVYHYAPLEHALELRAELSESVWRMLAERLPGGALLLGITSIHWRESWKYGERAFRYCNHVVHRVEDLTPGLYALVREPSRRAALAQALDPSFAWTPAGGESFPLPLYLLEAGDARADARRTSCDQAIAADGVFAAATLAEFRGPLEELGAWFYRRLHWETGALGQLLYLEAEATGIRATGIGCFFDDLAHRVFGIEGDRFQVLYHFTMGGAREDPRLETQPPYGHLARAGRSPS
jgi:nitroreductase